MKNQIKNYFFIILVMLSFQVHSEQNLGPYPGEKYSDSKILESDQDGRTIGGVKPGGKYYYRYVEITDVGATSENVIPGHEIHPQINASSAGNPDRNNPSLNSIIFSKRHLIRQAMNRWEKATNNAIEWIRCDNNTNDSKYPDCVVDAQGNPEEVVIGIDIARNDPNGDGDDEDYMPLGCSHAWKFEHPGEPNPLFQNRRMAFNSLDLIREFTVTHELGHCLGLKHEHSRSDRAHWLAFKTWEEDAIGQGRENLNVNMVTDNFSYNSPMSYGGHVKNFHCGHDITATSLPFSLNDGIQCTYVGYAPPFPDDSLHILSDLRDDQDRVLIPPEDGSKVKQLHARTNVSEELYYFNTLNQKTPALTNSYGKPVELMLNPEIDDFVLPIGSPALSTQYKGYYNAFVRGSNHNLYWRKYIGANGWDVNWRNITSSGDVNSSPAAVSWSNSNIVVAYVNDNGSIQYRKTSGQKVTFTSSFGWKPIGGTIKQSKIPNSSVAHLVNNGHIGVALTSRKKKLFDIIAVHENDHGNGELAINIYNNGHWNGWSFVKHKPKKWSIVQRPSAIVKNTTKIIVTATVKNTENGNCGLMEYEIEMPDPAITVQGGTLQATLASTKFNGKGSINCSSPPAILDSNDILPGHHIFAVNESNHLLYRRSNWPKKDYREVGGLPKKGTGLAVTHQSMSLVSGMTLVNKENMLILMNGSDLKQKYQYNAITKKLTAPSVQAGGIWFRRWGDID